MKTNKKIIQSILTLGIFTLAIFSFPATSETWADSQEAISTRYDLGTGSVKLVVDGQEAYHNSHETATVPGVELHNVIPTPVGANGIAPDVKIKTFTIQNKGSRRGNLYVQFVPVTQTLGEGSNVVIKLGDVELYNDGVNEASIPVYIVDVPEKSGQFPGTVTEDLVYNFADTGINQNEFENKELKFDLVFTLRATR